MLNISGGWRGVHRRDVLQAASVSVRGLRELLQPGEPIGAALPQGVSAGQWGGQAEARQGERFSYWCRKFYY